MKLQLASVIALVLAIVGAAAWIKDEMAEHREEILRLNYELAQMRDILTMRTDDRWRMTDQIQWASRLRLNNPDLIVPIVGERSPTAGDYQ